MKTKASIWDNKNLNTEYWDQNHEQVPEDPANMKIGPNLYYKVPVFSSTLLSAKRECNFTCGQMEAEKISLLTVPYFNTLTG